MMNKATNLRRNAEFEIEVFPGIYWVPANALGQSNINHQQIKEICRLGLEEKKDNIHNLYEAIQLFQKSRFAGKIDNIRTLEEASTILWVFHKNGLEAVRTNEGCCAANSNWLCYMLKNKYEKIGCIGHCLEDGNGHIINYILHEGWYYFIDMMMQRYDSVKNTGSESGDMNDFAQNLPSGYIYKAKGFDAFINYCIHINQNQHRHLLFYATDDCECVCIGTQYQWEADQQLYHLREKSRKILFYKDSVRILYAADQQTYGFTESKAIAPDWRLIPSFDFSKI